MYVPAVRVIVIDLVPCENVAVAAMFEPSVTRWTVRLCGTTEGLVRTIVTFPAGADRVVVLSVPSQRSRPREMTSRWMSEVPSSISSSLASRIHFCTGYSRE